jgi:hypothetical protein
MSHGQGHRNAFLAATLFLILFTAIDCAHVVVRKVIADSANPKENNNPPGFRYYLPRPFVAVKQEFPVDSEDKYTYGTVKIINGSKWLKIPQKVLKELNIYIDESQAVPSETKVRDTLQGQLSSGTKGGDGNAAKDEKDKTASGATNSAADKTTDSTPESASTAAGGGHVPLSGLFDIVYLPDYGEQYAIELVAGLWMLESIAVKTDNTALTDALFAQIGKVMDFASTVGLAKLGVPQPSEAGTSLQGLVAGPVKPEKVEAEGEQILIRIRTVTYVVPGVYPIYKPAELKSTKKPADAPPWAAGGSPDNYDVWVFTSPLWRDTVAFRTRKEVTFEAVHVDASEQAISQSPAPPPIDQIATAGELLRQAGLSSLTVIDVKLDDQGRPTEVQIKGCKKKNDAQHATDALTGNSNFSKAKVVCK